MSALIDSLQAGFAALPASATDAAELGDARRLALAAAVAHDLPTQREERWKYTALRALGARRFATSANTPVLDVAALAEISAPRLVFVNGAYSALLSDLSGLPDGVELQPLSRAIGSGDARSVNFLARRFATDEAFAQLNAAFAGEGALLRAAADTRSDVAIHLVFAGAAADSDLAAHSRHLIELRENARLTVIEHHLGTGAHRHLFNHLVHVHLKPGSELVHARVQSSGALLASGRRHVDTRLGIEHVARDTSCDLLWRGLAGGRGRAVFHGGIVIRAGADGAAASLSNKNLLLSDSAEIDTQPVLEIHADEVTASHGATVGRLDPTHLFYLRARGIPEAQARALLTAAFCRQTLASLAQPALIEALAARLDARLSALEIVA
jgi:Fe-S cluster assembly protein SufD